MANYGFNEIKRQYSLEQLQDFLAMENAFTSGIQGLFKDTTTHIAKLFSKIKIANADNVTSTTTSDIQAKCKKLSMGDLKHGYFKLRDTVIQVPEGFDGNLTDYSYLLLDTSKGIFADARTRLDRLRVITSSVANGSSDHNSMIELDTLRKDIVRFTDGIKHELAKYHTKSSASRAIIVDVVPSYNELEEFSDNLKMLGKQITYSNIDSVRKKTDELNHVLTVIETNIEKTIPSPEQKHAIRAVASAGLDAGRMVETVSIFYYSAMSLIGCGKVIFEKIEHV